ncbi:hypothetical protein HOY82DRAFT_652278 [Tuber indicum]|nr:hypothetical protein HOY82DRAFT_639904 [Tuber indicum]KAG0129230.1 hypothetical protein HOY82DRAFT_652278 [Tuber indicum]
MEIAAIVIDDKTVKIGFSIHDGLCVVDDYANLSSLSYGNHMQDLIRENTIHTIVALSKSRLATFVAAGATLGLKEMCTGLSAYIRRKLDVVLVLSKVQARASSACGDATIDIAEKEDFASRELVSCFGPYHNPALIIGFQNQEMPDAQGAIKLVDSMRDYESTYAYEWRGYNAGKTKGDPQSPHIKIALFSATPQGGGVGLMRHALVRFCSELGVDMSWYIPEADSVTFRISQTNHNILQAVANPARYWLTPGGPLAPGGADVIVIDDHQMPALIPLIKKARPEVKIIYRSHIEVRKDLVEPVGSPQE